MLFTDMLEGQFGDIHTEVLLHNRRCRVVHLRDALNISRTYAITVFAPDISRSLSGKITSRLRTSSVSAGHVLKDAGYELHRKVRRILKVYLPSWLMHSFEVNKAAAPMLLSELFITRKKHDELYYGLIAEVVSPSLNNVFFRLYSPYMNLPSHICSSSDFWQYLNCESYLPAYEQKVILSEDAFLQNLEELQYRLLHLFPLGYRSIDSCTGYTTDVS